MAALASDWLRHFRLLFWICWIEFNETGQEARCQCPLLSLCFSGRSEKQDGRPGLWFAETFSTSPLKPLNGIHWNLTGSKISTSSTKFVFFMPTGKTRWPPRPLIGWDIFDFSSETAEWNSKKLDRKEDLNVLYQVCGFSGRSEKQYGCPGLWLAETFSTSPLKPLNGIHWNSMMGSKISTSSTKFVFFVPIGKTRWLPWSLIGWLLRHFRLLWNCWIEFNETWQETRSQCPLPSLCFSGQSEKQDYGPSLWLAETFSTSPPKPLNRIQWNLTRRKISMSSTKFVFFGPIIKTRWPPRPLIVWDILTSPLKPLNRIQRNLTARSQRLVPSLYFFLANRKNKMTALVSDWLKHFSLLLWNC